jgi:hypothetical protein
MKVWITNDHSENCILCEVWQIRPVRQTIEGDRVWIDKSRKDLGHFVCRSELEKIVGKLPEGEFCVRAEITGSLLRHDKKVINKREAAR